MSPNTAPPVRRRIWRFLIFFEQSMAVVGSIKRMRLDRMFLKQKWFRLTLLFHYSLVPSLPTLPVLPLLARCQVCISIIQRHFSAYSDCPNCRCGRRSQMHEYHLERLHGTRRRRTYAELGQWNHCHHGFENYTCISRANCWYLFTSWRHILREQKLGWTALYCQVRIYASPPDPYIKCLHIAVPQ